MRAVPLSVLLVLAGCVDDQGTAVSDDEAGGDPEPPGPSGEGCDIWEPDAPKNLRAMDPEFTPGSPSAGRAVIFEPTGVGGPLAVPRPRGTLIANQALLSVPRGPAMSWCVGNIRPFPLGPGGKVNEELDAVNLENYLRLLGFVEPAAREWERHGKVNFVRVPEFDDRRKKSGGTCNPAVADIWFRVEIGTCDDNGFAGLSRANGETEFEASERCLADEPACELPVAKADPHWKPVVGQFASDEPRLDVLLVGVDDIGEELLLRNDGTKFEAIPKSVHGRPVPVVGQFLANNRDQLLLYGPGDAPDEIWVFADDGSHEVVPIERDGYFIPIPGKFRGPSGATDIVWWDPHGNLADAWNWSLISPFEYGTSGSFLELDPRAEYVPLVGDFDGDFKTDIFWYAPGEPLDQLWLSISTPHLVVFEVHDFNVTGSYRPFVGDFNGDETDDIFWYRAGHELDSGVSLVWYMNGASPPTPRNFAIHRDYAPYVADFDSDGCSDVMWYEAHRPSSTPIVWTCMNGMDDFDCQSGLELPTNGYLIGWTGGGY